MATEVYFNVAHVASQTNMSLLSQAPYEEEPPAYTSPVAAKYETPAVNRTVKFDSPQEPDASDRKPAAETLLTPQTSPDSNANADLAGQLSQANAQIQRLKQQVAENELRQRKPVKSEGDDSNLQQQQVPQQSAESGVPLQIVAGLCLLSFLLAYIFF